MRSRFGHEEIQNLDAMSEAELRTFRSEHPALNRYARLKAVAMAYRKRGNIPMAGAFEAECEKTYEQLPKRLRW